ncbi:MAG: cytochrome c oxidase subunit II, partial [Bdellovibrionota bacterium]
MFFHEAYAGSLPIAATDLANHWDTLYLFLVYLSIFFFVLVVGAMLYFAVAYRTRPGIKTKYFTGNHLLEATWIAIPTVLLMVIFGWGWTVYREMTQAPTDAYEIHVIGKQWLWTFQYDNGKTTVGDLYVPMNRPVKMIMTSEDVIHSFFVPNFRVKQDVVPGMYTSVWFEARVPGKHQIFCAEYCGTSHSGMLGKVIVLNDQQWNDWLSGKKLGAIPDATDVAEVSDTLQRSQASAIGAVASSETKLSVTHPPLAAQCKAIFENRGCTACHTIDGSTKVGPSLKGVYNSKIELQDGNRVVADENYLRESIELPQAKL